MVREAQELVELALKGMLRAVGISKRRRKERELAFCGDLDFIPTAEYSVEDAAGAYEEAAWILALARHAIAPSSGRRAGQ